EEGIGFNRTVTGSNALAQYPAELAKQYADLNTVPENVILWFHRLGWDYKMKSGRTLWEELVDKYYGGVTQVRDMQAQWKTIEGQIDAERFTEVNALLAVQERDAVRWRDSCVLYFQTLSKLPIPEGYEKPEHDLEYYKMLARISYVPDPWHPASASRVLK
ncbi:MAG: alpha-glucuronidase, partial [Moraxellaceae bacterium]